MLSTTLHDPDEAAPLILYLHGLGIAGWCWEATIDALPNYGALVPDLPGHGDSNHVPWQSIADTAGKLCEIVDGVPPARQVYVVGHSLGAYVGMELLAKRPERWAGAVLSGFHIGSPGYPLLLKFAYVLNGLVFRVPPLVRRFGSIFGDDRSVERFIDGAKVIRSSTIRRAGIQVVDFDMPAGIDAVRVPILAISGALEPEAIRAAPRVLSERLADVDAVVLEGRDHLWPIKEPALYAAKLDAFFARG